MQLIILVKNCSFNFISLFSFSYWFLKSFISFSFFSHTKSKMLLFTWVFIWKKMVNLGIFFIFIILQYFSFGNILWPNFFQLLVFFINLMWVFSHISKMKINFDQRNESLWVVITICVLFKLSKFSLDKKPPSYKLVNSHTIIVKIILKEHSCLLLLTLLYFQNHIL